MSHHLLSSLAPSLQVRLKIFNQCPLGKKMFPFRRDHNEFCQNTNILFQLKRLIVQVCYGRFRDPGLCGVIAYPDPNRLAAERLGTRLRWGESRSQEANNLHSHHEIYLTRNPWKLLFINPSLSHFGLKLYHYISQTLLSVLSGRFNLVSCMFGVLCRIANCLMGICPYSILGTL